ncbi:MAG: 4Fe-4S cluster-binding domain-containing protein [Lachnospiraceae bacterium]|nr:4Fe-4S cluster-binding domain-containing protein [Lachnospiraceae bacterium]
MNYANIKFNDIANGEGVRTSLFVSGCTHHCKHCFNPETWDFNYGKVFTQEVQDKIIASPDIVANSGEDCETIVKMGEEIGTIK